VQLDGLSNPANMCLGSVTAESWPRVWRYGSVLGPVRREQMAAYFLSFMFKYISCACGRDHPQRQERLDKLDDS
jgi:hypothetical protein